MKRADQSGLRGFVIVGGLCAGLIGGGGCGDDADNPGGADAAPPAVTLDGGLTDAAFDAPDTAPPRKLACEELPSLAIPASQIGLPTGGGTITASHTVVPDAGAAMSYCLVEARIASIDPVAPPIQLHVALPVTWNGKAMLLGGGGFDGTIPDVTGNVLNAPPAAPSPLAAGYAVFASDSGHSSTSPPALAGLDGSFAVNTEAYKNWIGDAVKKTRDVAMQVILASYGAAPTRSYAVGSSTGGREALACASRFSADWDGVVALYPGRNITVTLAGMAALSRALAQPGAFPNAAKRNALNSAVLALCDIQDGVADGVVSNITACNFDPASLRCAGGADTGDTCLSDAQITAIKAINAPVPLGFQVASGETDFAGYNVYGAGQGIGTTTPIEPGVEAVDLGAAAPAFPFSVAAGMPYAAGFADGFLRYALAGGTNFDYLTFDPSNPGATAARLTELSQLDVGDLDLSGFAAKGGKLLIMQGTADMLISPRETERYVATVQSKLGAATLDSFLRFYEVPGLQHEFSTTYFAAWDQIGALEAWVEKGVDPAENQSVTDLIGVPGRTRPLCRYPRFPKYQGSGDPNAAASFVCTNP